MHWYMKENKLAKGFPKREREALLSELRELLRIAKMENANFDGIVFAEFDPQNATAYIKEQTRGYREAWLIDPLEKLIARYEAG